MDHSSSEFQFNDAPRDTADTIADVERELGSKLPADYLAFMQEHDGGEGFVGANYLVLWRLTELVRFNREYEIPVYAPSLFAIGSNGGGEAFAFDRTAEDLPIVVVPFIGMSDNDAIRIADHFELLFARLRSTVSLFEDTSRGA